MADEAAGHERRVGRLRLSVAAMVFSAAWRMEYAAADGMEGDVAAVTELTLHSRTVGTVFDLLGRKEDDITYSVGWGLAQSERFTRSVLSEAYGDAK